MADTLATMPPELGPHEHQECILMLAGKKPLAEFSDIVESPYIWPDAVFEPHVKAGKIIKKEFRKKVDIRGKEYTHRHLYYALPGEEWRIDEMLALRGKSYNGDLEEIRRDDVKIGRLLGYTEKEIACFLEWYASRLHEFVRKA